VGQVVVHWRVRACVGRLTLHQLVKACLGRAWVTQGKKIPWKRSHGAWTVMEGLTVGAAMGKVRSLAVSLGEGVDSDV